MNRLFVYIPAAVILTAMGRFQETTVYHEGRLESRHAFYGQAVGIAVCIAVTLILLAATAKRRRTAHDPVFRLNGWPFWPWLFALPLFWQRATTIRHGGERFYTEISFGIGGPLTLVYFLTAAGAFIACEAWLKAKEGVPSPWL